MIAAPKRNSWKAAPLWFKILWWLSFVTPICDIIRAVNANLKTPEGSLPAVFGIFAYRAASITAHCANVIAFLWMYFRLRSETGPAARGAPWGVVAFVLFGWAYGVSGLVGPIAYQIVGWGYFFPYRAVSLAMAIISILGAYLLERRRMAGIVLTALSWVAEAAYVMVAALVVGAPGGLANPIVVFGCVGTGIILICLFRPSVFAWVRGSDTPPPPDVEFQT